MLWRLLLSAAVLVLVGCRAAERFSVMGPDLSGTSQTNLALGPSAEHAWLASQLTGRSEWPAVEVGQRFDDVTFYSTVIYDEQSYYDRFGSLFRESQSFRSGVWRR
jgi:hypothetical protein